MKLKIGNTNDEVEIGQYKAIDKGTLKASFSIVIYPSGQKTLDWKYFEQGESRWVAGPQKEVKYSDGRKTDYIPIVSYLNKDYQDALKTAILQLLKSPPVSAQPKPAYTVQSDASTLPF